MKKLAILGLLLLPATALADEPAVEPAAESDDGRVICRNITQIGSRLNRRRVCMTEAQWTEQRRIDREEMDNRQTRNCLGRCQGD